MHNRIHLLVAEMIRMQNTLIEKTTSPGNEIRRLLLLVGFSIRVFVSSVIKFAPNHLIFGRDMIIHDKELVNGMSYGRKWTEQAV